MQEKLLLDVMFDVPGSSIVRVTLTKEVVDGSSGPMLEMKPTEAGDVARGAHESEDEQPHRATV